MSDCKTCAAPTDCGLHARPVGDPPASPIGYRCRRGGRCADRARLRCPECDTSWGVFGTGIDTYDGLCDDCVRAVAVAVRGLGLDYAELGTLIHRSPGATDWTRGFIRTSTTPPIPVPAHLDLLQRELVEHATRWAAIVADELDITRTPDGPPEHIVHRHAETLVAVRTRRTRRLYDLGDRARAHALTAARADLERIADTELAGESGDRFDDGRAPVRLGHAVRVLTTSVGHLLTLPVQEFPHEHDDGWDRVDGVTAGVTLLALHEQVRRVCGRGDLTHHLPTPCPVCGVRALVRDNGDDRVRCGSCRNWWDEAQYDWLTHLAAYAYQGAA